MIGGDFFADDLPESDLFAVGRILHDWSAEKIPVLLARFLQDCRRAGDCSSQRNCCRGQVRANAGAHAIAQHADLHRGHGAARSASIARCLEAAGFAMCKVVLRSPARRGAGDQEMTIRDNGLYGSVQPTSPRSSVRRSGDAEEECSRAGRTSAAFMPMPSGSARLAASLGSSCHDHQDAQVVYAATALFSRPSTVSHTRFDCSAALKM